MMTRRLRRFAAACAVAASLLAPATIARASDAPAAAVETRAAASPSVDRTLDELAAAEDSSLAEQKAGKWRDGEVVCVTLLLIFVFPIGLIVLIALAVHHHHHH